MFIMLTESREDCEELQKDLTKLVIGKQVKANKLNTGKCKLIKSGKKCPLLALCTYTSFTLSAISLISDLGLPVGHYDLRR